VGTEQSWTHFLTGEEIQLCDHITENGEAFAYNKIINKGITKQSKEVF